MLTNFACTTHKNIESKAKKEMALTVNGESTSSSFNMDSIYQRWIFNADSIIISYDTSLQSPPPIRPNQTTRHEMDERRGGGGPEGNCTSPNLRLDDAQLPGCRQKAQVPRKQHSGSPSQLPQYRAGTWAARQGNAAIKEVRLYAPHINASNEERSISQSSKKDSTSVNEVTEEEEQTKVRQKRISFKSFLIFMIIVAAVAAVIIRRIIFNGNK